jgi:hypothetical protein
MEGEPRWTGEVAHFWNNHGIWSVWDRPNGTQYDSRTRYIYSLGPADQKSIANIFRDEARSYPTVCVLTELLDQLAPKSSPFEAPDSLLVTLAEHATHILVGAFDERGLVIWSRGGLCGFPAASE